MFYVRKSFYLLYQLPSPARPLIFSDSFPLPKTTRSSVPLILLQPPGHREKLKSQCGLATFPCNAPALIPCFGLLYFRVRSPFSPILRRFILVNSWDGWVSRFIVRKCTPLLPTPKVTWLFRYCPVNRDVVNPPLPYSA